MSAATSTRDVLLVSRMHHPVTTLGYGTRLGIWVQGCTLACPGCVSTDTWPADPSTAMPVEDVVTTAAALVGDAPLDGITISGGEPFEQPGALRALLTAIADHPVLGGPDVDLLAFSGLPLRTLQDVHSDVLGLLDVVIAEPYDGSRHDGGPLRGSDNQQIGTLSERGRSRYDTAGPVDRVDRNPDGPAMQLAVQDDRIWMIGIPRRGDLQKLEKLALTRGLRLEGVSWRA